MAYVQQVGFYGKNKQYWAVDEDTGALVPMVGTTPTVGTVSLPVTTVYATTVSATAASIGTLGVTTALTGGFPQTSGKGATATVVVNEEEITLSLVAMATDSSANLLPANSVILGVGYRVTTTINGGGVANYKIGDGSTADRFQTADTNLTAGSTGVGMEHLKLATLAAQQTSAAKLRITCDKQTTAGKVRVTVTALVFTAPTS